MKLLTVNFLTCAVKACKTSSASFPLHFKDAELEQREIDYNPAFIHNILPRLDWDAIATTAAELGFSTLPAAKPEGSLESEQEQKVMRHLHTLLLETEVMEGKMVCGNCGHEYKIKEGIANFLLPSHLGKSRTAGCPLSESEPPVSRAEPLTGLLSLSVTWRGIWEIHVMLQRLREALSWFATEDV
ncbi:MAG: hypothetical protein Q9183_001027 [Haloplaca sp. 2 TL-2023]